MELKRTRKAGGKRLWPLVLTVSIALVVITGIGLLSRQYLCIREINFYGNRHLSEGDLKTLTGCSVKSGLFSVSTAAIYQRLRKSPWIKEAMVRKDLTGRLDVHLTEAVAVGVLLAADKSYLVDRDGARLEEINPQPVYFLPVIRIDAVADRDAYTEAATLAGIMYDKKVTSQTGNIEISGDKPEDLTIKLDGLLVKIGSGDFAKKLDKLSFVKDEIAKRNMQVEYVDLRFVDKIVVKPAGKGAGDSGGTAAGADKQKKKHIKKGRHKGAGGKARKHVG